MPENPETHVHQQRYDGDDPYLVCGCGARWDAISGRPLNVAAGDDLAATPPPIPSEDREPLRTAIQAVLDARCRCGKVTADEVIDAASFRVAASSPVAPQALDARRLAEALQATPHGTEVRGQFGDLLPFGALGDRVIADAIREAQRIAAEYARLGGTSDDSEPAREEGKR